MADHISHFVFWVVNHDVDACDGVVLSLECLKIRRGKGCAVTQPAGEGKLRDEIRRLHGEEAEGWRVESSGDDDDR